MNTSKLISIEDFRVNREQQSDDCNVEGKILVPFLMGPIDLGWLGRAAVLPGKSLHLALAAAHHARLTHSDIVQLTPSVVEKFGIDGRSKLRALTALLMAGLFNALEKKQGKSATVRLIGYKPKGARR